MSNDAPWAGWLRTNLGAITTEEGGRVGTGPPPIVLSSTKHRGLVPSDEFFKGRTIYSANLINYKSVRRNWFAYATNHLAEGSIGLQARWENACVSPIYTVFSCRDSVDPRFLLRVLKSPDSIAAFKVFEQASVDRRGAVRYRDFAKVAIDLPPLREQLQIEECLHAMDTAISSTERVIVKLEQMKLGLLHDLFTCGISEDGALRDPTVHPEQFVETPLGKLPKSWNLARLRDFCEIRSGSTPSRQSHADYYSDCGIPWAKTLDLNEDRLLQTDERVTELALRHTSCALLPAGSVLVAMYGGWAQIGRTALLAIDATTNQAISGLTIRDRTHPGFLLRALQHGRSRWRFVAASTRKDPNITKDDVANFVLPIPPREEQIAIAECVDAQVDAIVAESRNLQKFRHLKDGLSDDLLAGRVRVAMSEDAA